MIPSLQWQFAAFLAVLLGGLNVLAGVSKVRQRESSSEHLLLHSLDNSFVAVTSAVALHGSPSLHHTTFPRALSTLLDSFPIQELKLTLARGRWRHSWYGQLSSTSA